LDLPPEQFVTFIQNHDQIANSLHGLRLHQLTGPGQFRALTALLLLGPGTPMLFQGQEFAASTPFLFFADHNPELARLVAAGRKAFLQQFPSVVCSASEPHLADPGAEETFVRCKLQFSERQTNAGLYEFHRDLLSLRREDPVFSKPRSGAVDGAVLGPAAFVLRFFGDSAGDRLLLINLGTDLHLTRAAESLLAPLEGTSWAMLWSSEAPRYGGCGSRPLESNGPWDIQGHAAVVLRTQLVNQ
jgi:maltooligosyltrehalose trehalohydrolase